MSYRIAPVDVSKTEGKTQELLGTVKARMGMVPNMMRTMANSTAGLEGYLGLSGALAAGKLSAKIREQIALAVSQKNGCEYCLSAHTLVSGKQGVKPDQAIAARHGHSDDPKTQAVLQLALQILDQRGSVSDEEVDAARAAGISDAEMVEIVGHVALNVLTNSFNNFARTEVDFPRVELSL